MAVTFSLPRDVVKLLDIAAAKEERTRSKLVELAVRKYAASAQKALP